jgi:serine/threonine-protein kinase
VLDRREHGPRTDIFSLGTVLYLLATGQLPFRGKNPHQVLKQIVDGRYADPAQVRPAIGNTMKRIIARCLEVDPERRYANASELEHDLLRFVTPLGIESPDATLAEFLPEPEAYIARFRALSIERLATLGEEARRAGDMPHALDCFNRVLALDGTNARVLGVLGQLGRRRKLQRAALGVGLVALLGGALFVVGSTRGLQRPSVERTASTDTRVTGAVDGPIETPDLVADDQAKRAAAEPAAPAGADAAPRPPKRPRPPRGDGPRLVVFQPFPQNTSISVDGGPLRPFGPSFHEVELEPGLHRFKFVGGRDCCEDEVLEVRVPAGPGETLGPAGRPAARRATGSR